MKKKVKPVPKPKPFEVGGPILGDVFLDCREWTTGMRYLYVRNPAATNMRWTLTAEDVSRMRKWLAKAEKHLRAGVKHGA